MNLKETIEELERVRFLLWELQMLIADERARAKIQTAKNILNDLITEVREEYEAQVIR